MKKFFINGQTRNNFFLLSSSRFSLVKAAMNAARVYKLCEGVKKRLNFFFFQLPKAEQRP